MSDNNPNIEDSDDSQTEKVATFRVVVVAPCGHPIKEAKYAGTPSNQNRWVCRECGKFFQR